MSRLEDYLKENVKLEVHQVTARNIEEIAVWCKGDLGVAFDGVTVGDTSGTMIGKSYIQVDPANLLAKPSNRAFIGDWVLSNGVTFFTCSDSDYQQAMVITNRIRYLQVRHLVMRAQWEVRKAVGATEYSKDLDVALAQVAETIANQIVALD
jgi:hypothetical protein